MDANPLRLEALEQQGTKHISLVIFDLVCGAEGKPGIVDDSGQDATKANIVFADLGSSFGLCLMNTVSFDGLSHKVCGSKTHCNFEVPSKDANPGRLDALAQIGTILSMLYLGTEGKPRIFDDPGQEETKEIMLYVLSMLAGELFILN